MEALIFVLILVVAGAGAVGEGGGSGVRLQAHRAGMIRWLLSTEGLRLRGERTGMLVLCGRRRPSELVPLFGSAELFRDHIPRLVWNEYGTGSPAGPEQERSTS